MKKNSIVERFNGTLKSKFKVLLEIKILKWFMIIKK